MEKKFIINGQEITVQDYQQDSNQVSFALKGKTYKFDLISRHQQDLILQGKERLSAHVGTSNAEGEAMVIAGGREGIISVAGKKKKKTGAHAGGLTSPMPGKIFKVVKEVGSEIKKGEVILILEAMKMEHAIRSDKDGKVKNIFFKTGELVQGGVTLAEVE